MPMIKKTLCFSNPAYLSLRDDQLVIKLPEVEKADNLTEEFKKSTEVTRAIEDIGVVVLDHKQITITQGVLEALLANNCSVITCDSSHMPVGLQLPLAGNTTQNEKFRNQLDASLPLRKQLWQQTMQQKIRNQAAVLGMCSDAETRCMQVWANEVRSGDPDNLEARAAIYYWSHLFGHIPGFIRSRQGIAPNNFLNYGYAILRSCVAKTLTAYGYYGTIGIHHENASNPFNLADDMMEPLRPVVDMVTDRMCDDLFEHLSRDNRSKLVNIVNLPIKMNGRKIRIRYAIDRCIASLTSAIADNNADKLILPELIMIDEFFEDDEDGE